MNKRLLKLAAFGCVFGWMLFAPSVCLVAQDTAYARRVIAHLSSDILHGRGASYGGDMRAAEFIRGELARMGVEPLGDRYFQSYCFNTFSMEGPCWMKVNGRQLKVYDEFRPAFWSASINEDVAQFVALPIETFLDADALQKFIAKSKSRLSNSVIYIDCSRYKPIDDEDRRFMNRRLDELKQRNPFGSKAIVVGREQLATPSPAGSEYERGYAYAEVLCSAMPKRVKTFGLGINTQFLPNHKVVNVMGMVRGEVDSMIVYTAHYDHLGCMGEALKSDNEDMVGNEVIFPGAHDNASGVAAVLDLARMAMEEKPHYTMVFMFFSGEESGLKGSMYQAAHPSIDYSKVRVLVNIDLFCGGEDGLMVFNATDPRCKGFFDRVVLLNKSLGIAPEIRPRDMSFNSDHAPFYKLCPVMYVLSMGHPYGGYHSPSDNCKGCGLEYYHNHLVLISTIGL